MEVVPYNIPQPTINIPKNNLLIVESTRSGFIPVSPVKMYINDTTMKIPAVAAPVPPIKRTTFFILPPFVLSELAPQRTHPV